jgi:N-acetylglucosaminyldiphosphoundecaprenol N-acetyl-beta-D-mannosaminyltransferase
MRSLIIPTHLETLGMPFRGNILGVHVSAINIDQALETIGGWLARREPNYVCVTPAHVVMDCWRNPDLRIVVNHSGLTTPDGMSIVWLLKLHGYHDVGRVSGTDLMREVCRVSETRSWRHFFYGGAPGVADALAGRLRTSSPKLQIAGIYSPPFRPLTEAEDRAVIERINASNADILWIGISSPRQDAWMADHLGKINAPVMIGVGAAFDFLSGRKRQAPPWIQRAGMEWLFRLASEPRRLWRRYAEYPFFAMLVIAQTLGLTRYD